jgi:hypothetical protein
MRVRTLLLLTALLAAASVGDADGARGRRGVVTWKPAPGEKRSEEYELTVNGVPVFVYEGRARQEMVDPPDSILTHEMGGPAERVSYALFDISERAEIVVRTKEALRTAKLWPTSAGIEPEIEGREVRFTLETPRHVTLLPNGRDVRVLHLFVGRPEKKVPRPGDPSVLYFGPGVHDVELLEIPRRKKALYIAGGGVVRAKLPPDAKGTRNEKSGLVSYGGPVILLLQKRGFRIYGRGILDGSAIPHAGKCLVHVLQSEDVSVEGILLRDSPAWNVTVDQSKNVEVSDVRILSSRLNSDGINSVGSDDVRIHDCFVRNHDDAIVVKTTHPSKPASNIRVERCTIWNDWGYAFGVTYETRAPIHDLLFRDSDVLFVRFAALGIRVCDAGHVSRITFDDVRVEDLSLAAKRFGKEPMLVSVEITKDMWGTDEEAGRISDIRFVNVTAHAWCPASTLRGQDDRHAVDGVTFKGLKVAGRCVTAPGEARISVGKHVKNLSFE